MPTREIIDVLSFTLERFGEAQYLDYFGLIGGALETLETHPASGKRRPNRRALPRPTRSVLGNAARAWAAVPWFGARRRIQLPLLVSLGEPVTSKAIFASKAFPSTGFITTAVLDTPRLWYR